MLDNIKAWGVIGAAVWLVVYVIMSIYRLLTNLSGVWEFIGNHSFIFLVILVVITLCSFVINEVFGFSFVFVVGLLSVIYIEGNAFIAIMMILGGWISTCIGVLLVGMGIISVIFSGETLVQPSYDLGDDDETSMEHDDSNFSVGGMIGGYALSGGDSKAAIATGFAAKTKFGKNNPLVTMVGISEASKKMNDK